MVIWYCCSEIIYKNHVSKTRSGEKIKFYRLPRDLHLYALKTVGINFEMDTFVVNIVVRVTEIVQIIS